MRYVLLVTVILLILVNEGQSAITLNINTYLKEFWFTGSDTGSSPVYEFEDWRSGIRTGDDANIVLPGAFTIDVGSVRAILNVYEAGAPSFVLELRNSGTVTVMADESKRFSYADWSIFVQGFEDFSNEATTLVPSIGAGFSPVTVNTVPEPSIWALIGIGALALGSAARRRLHV